MGALSSKVLQILSRETQKTFASKIAASPKIVDTIDATVKTSTDIQKSTAVKTSKEFQPLNTIQISIASQTIPNQKIENSKTMDTQTQTELPTEDNKENTTQTPISKEEIIHLGETQTPFNIQTEIAKLKISIPLTKLIRNDSYKAQITKKLNIVEGEDSINLNDDQPELIFGTKVNGKHE